MSRARCSGLDSASANERSAEVPAGALRLLDAVVGERDVGAAGVLPALRPLRLSVTDEDEFAGAFRGHEFLPIQRPSAAAPTETTSIPRPFRTASRVLPDRRSCTVSTLAVENVVYPPIMPVPSTATAESGEGARLPEARQQPEHERSGDVDEQRAEREPGEPGPASGLHDAVEHEAQRGAGTPADGDQQQFERAHRASAPRRGAGPGGRGDPEPERRPRRVRARPTAARTRCPPPSGRGRAAARCRRRACCRS